MTGPNANPGWYPDPSGEYQMRYWDGSNWGAGNNGPGVAGSQQPQRSNRGKIWVAVVAVLAILWVVGSLDKKDDSRTSSSSSSSSSSASAPSLVQVADPTPTAAPAGSSVRDGKFEFQVLGVTRAAQAGQLDNQFMIEQAQGEFIIVTLVVTNIGDRPQTYFGSNQKLIDTAGRQYEPNSAADMYMNDNRGDINPGNSIQVKAAFDVPPGTVPEKLDLHDSMFSGGAELML